MTESAESLADFFLDAIGVEIEYGAKFEHYNNFPRGWQLYSQNRSEREFQR